MRMLENLDLENLNKQTLHLIIVLLKDLAHVNLSKDTDIKPGEDFLHIHKINQYT